jgi:hypothetical protein
MQFGRHRGEELAGGVSDEFKYAELEHLLWGSCIAADIDE